MERPKPEIITPPAQYLPVIPPSDAIVLFDGSDLSNWRATDGSETKWICKDGYMECVEGSGYIQSKQKFGDIQLHVEWMAPTPVEGSSQGRGNSGVFLMGEYEVQVLDSYENVTYADGQASAIYGQYPPLVNASRPPGEWQSYDIIFRRPRFDALGKLVSPAIMTVFHNGVLVQDHRELWGKTDWLKYTSYKAHAEALPLSFQDHGNPVRFRNVWVRDLETAPEPKPDYPSVISLDGNILQKYAGTYKHENRTLELFFIDGTLYLQVYGNRKFELIAHSKTHFSAKATAIELNFNLDNDGRPMSFNYFFEGHKTLFKKAE